MGKRLKKSWLSFEKQSTRKTYDATEEELGDLLFAMVNLARFYKIDPEVAVHRTNHKFEKRFQYIEERVESKNEKLEICHLRN